MPDDASSATPVVEQAALDKLLIIAAACFQTVLDEHEPDTPFDDSELKVLVTTMWLNHIYRRISVDYAGPINFRAERKAFLAYLDSLDNRELRDLFLQLVKLRQGWTAELEAWQATRHISCDS